MADFDREVGRRREHVRTAAAADAPAAAEREFVFKSGRFYSVIDEGAASAPTADGGRTFVSPAVGVWAMSDITTELPGATRSVRVVARGPLVDENGQSWQERAIRAEMALAQQRTELGEAEGRARVAARTAQAVTRSRDADVRVAEEGRIEAERKRVRDLRVIAEKLAGVYGRTAEFEALNGPDSGSYGSWCEVHDELFHDHDHDHIDAARLLEFITGVLDLDHPSVRFPLPGPRTVAESVAVSRRVLATPGKTFDESVIAGLATAARIMASPG